jgi:hypothetical protein
VDTARATRRAMWATTNSKILTDLYAIGHNRPYAYEGGISALAT